MSRTVIAATVTYGSRASLCRQVVEAALLAGCAHVVIVDNGSSDESRSELEALAATSGSVTLTARQPNLGSAVGFGQAIEVASRLGDYIWLLDDDNAPDPRALQPLLHEFDGREESRLVLFSYRDMESSHRALLAGRPAFPEGGSFMYFDVWRILRRGSEGERPSESEYHVPYGPYGGLFGRTATIASINPPREEFFLYEDDTEFTSRLAHAGVELRLCPESKIHEIDGKWSSDGSVRGPARFLLSEHHDRVWLAVRNRTVVDLQRSEGRRFRFLVNRTIYFGVALAQAVRHLAFSSLGRMVMAHRAGVSLYRELEDM